MCMVHVCTGAGVFHARLRANCKCESVFKSVLAWYKDMYKRNMELVLADRVDIPGAQIICPFTGIPHSGFIFTYSSMECV